MAQDKTYYQKIAKVLEDSEEAERINKLFNDNINLANSIAKKYYKTGYWEFDEAVQIAQMGLWKACLTWDPGKYKLSTLAYTIISRDFINYDTQQKKQPDILFNLEDNVVTDNLDLNDVFQDETDYVEKEMVEQDEVSEINRKVLEILDEVAKEMNLSSYKVKLVYLYYLNTTEPAKDKIHSLKGIVKKSTITEIMNRVREKLTKFSKKSPIL